MLSTRDMKRRARVQLHERMSDPVIYIETPASEHVGVLARLHLSFKEIGELLRGGFADRAEMTPSIVFMRQQAHVVRQGVVVTCDMGAYRIDQVYPPDDITVTAEVIKLTDSQVVANGWDLNAPYYGLPIPPITVSMPSYPVFSNWTTIVAAPGEMLGAPLSGYDQKLDTVSPSLSYFGEAAPGSATSDAVWRIRRITTTGNDLDVDWAGGSASFTHKWDDRLTLSY